MKFVIPSYNRSQEIQSKTLRYLLLQNVPKKSIYIFIRKDDSDFDSYTDIDNEINIIATDVKGIGKTHNAITEYFSEGEFIVELDDDMIDLIDTI